jgi:hypothetical protein
MRDPSQTVPRTSPLRRLAGLVVLAGLAAAARAESTGRCLTPEVEQALGPFVGGGALSPVLGKEFRLTRGDIGGNQIELEIQDQAQHSYVLDLALPESRSAPPDGAGRRFAYYLDAPAASNPGAKAALLAAASILDQAVPDTAIQPCSQPAVGEAEVGGAPDRGAVPVAGSTNTDQPQARPADRYPRALALGSAVAQIAILLVAIVYGMRVIASMPPVPGAQSDDEIPE